MNNDSWQTQEHANTFDTWSKLSKHELRKIFESFNEINLFLKYKNNVKNKTFVEIGCATGELYRYLKSYHHSFKYTGFDVSLSAITRCKKKFSDGKFILCDENLTKVRFDNKIGVLFSRDVVVHQSKPFTFLKKLISFQPEIIILRLRTRDKGKTVFDTDLSCQKYHKEEWVPYIILNIDEMIGFFKKNINFKKLVIVRNYVQLGGYENRYLPKDCYLTTTGTSETSLYLDISDNSVNNPIIEIYNKKDGCPKYSLIEKAMMNLRNFNV